MAIQRLLRHNKKKEHPTRRDYVMEKIKNNISHYNDPSGDTTHFESMLLGLPSKMSSIQVDPRGSPFQAGSKHYGVQMTNTESHANLRTFTYDESQFSNISHRSQSPFNAKGLMQRLDESLEHARERDALHLTPDQLQSRSNVNDSILQETTAHT